ncbi:MAG: hypothetical protein LHV69_08340 [Elusimicrobia bacterium]|nr:hypothetical protein [Candidatus Obscuribacterium magneticum]
MKKISEEKLKKLDEMNLAWLLEQISVGKIVRGYLRLVEAIKPVASKIKSCIQCEETAAKSKPAHEEKAEG